MYRVFMGPANALESSGVMLVSGDQDITQKILPWLQTMTGKVINLGDRTGKAAGVKLLGNMFLITLTGGFSDMLATAKAMDLPASVITDLFSEWNPGAAAPARLQRILSADYDNPSWELQMARKDARLMMEEAARGRKNTHGDPRYRQRNGQMDGERLQEQRLVCYCERQPVK